MAAGIATLNSLSEPERLRLEEQVRSLGGSDPAEAEGTLIHWLAING
jgi:hypothetical protein